MVNEELAPKQMLYDKGYATNSPVLQLNARRRRCSARSRSTRATSSGSSTRSAQFEAQIGQIESDYQLKVAQELEDARNKLADARSASAWRRTCSTGR